MQHPIEIGHRTAAHRRRRNSSSVGKMLDELEWPSLEARRDQNSLLLFTRFIVEQCLLTMTSTWPLLTVWKLPGHYIVLNIVDTRHTVMPWRIPLPRTIPHWNSLSPSVANTQTTEEFRALILGSGQSDYFSLFPFLGQKCQYLPKLITDYPYFLMLSFYYLNFKILA